MATLLMQLSPAALAEFGTFQRSWERLAEDGYMADGGRYRQRRHATFSAAPSAHYAQLESHQPHYQTLDYNPLNGGVARHYLPIEDGIQHGATLTTLLNLGCTLFGKLRPDAAWHIEVHQFRIEAGRGMEGRQTPEGVHRDGVNFVMMLMVKRHNVVNGATTIYDLNKQRLDQFTLTEPLDLAIVDDEQIYHGVTPIVRLDPAHEAHRDVLVITFRRRD
ncbi:2OG-Fe dioxygenase family protein [Crenobacter sp. SG2305]|uniref:2OG-Fe dioxygenase family protein n=1 Tax=Crenobacter oryzisoli TaxID=3056844 RepID=UPI0025AA4039|nr:2OG-Fe dioxygenase family protein [Crenobacter sp. SG2305]MDN0082604.1 2OG-Fe dioxygenase family protein [Crenobacter sp. SG2305]